MVALPSELKEVSRPPVAVRRAAANSKSLLPDWACHLPLEGEEAVAISNVGNSVTVISIEFKE